MKPALLLLSKRLLVAFALAAVFASFYSNYFILLLILAFTLFYVLSAFAPAIPFRSYLLAVGLTSVYLFLHFKAHLSRELNLLLPALVVACFFSWAFHLYREKKRPLDFINGIDLFFLNGAFLFAGFALIYYVVRDGWRGVVPALGMVGLTMVSLLLFCVVAKISHEQSKKRFSSVVWLLTGLFLSMAAGRMLYAYAACRQAEIALEKGALEDSLGEVNSALSITGHLGLPGLEARLLQLKAENYQRINKYGEALEALSAARKLEDTPDRRVKAVELYVRAGELQQGAALLNGGALKRVSEFNSLSAYARVRLAFYLFKKGEAATVGKLLETLLEREHPPDDLDGPTLYYLALLCSEWKKLAQAQQLFLDATRKDPALADAYYQAGKLVDRQGKDVRALEYYSRAVETLPTHLDSLLQLRRILVGDPNPGLRLDNLP